MNEWIPDDIPGKQPKPKPLPDRLPPHDPESEQGVLGSVFLDPSTALPLIIKNLKSGAETFYDLRHQTICGIFLELFEDGIPIDIITVQERLKMWGKLDEIGGIQYLSQLPDCVPSAANLPTYLEIVKGKYTLRRMIQTCTEVVGQIFESEGSVDEIMDECEKKILKIGEDRRSLVSLNIEDLVHQAIAQMEAATQHHGTVSGLPTGFMDFDKMTNGMHPGQMIVIAARPKIGKTSLALNIAEHVAVDMHLPVGVVSMEMTGLEIASRMICSRARVNIRNAKEGFIAQTDFPKLTSASVSIHHSPIYINDQGGQSIMQIRAQGRMWAQQHHIKLMIVDYIQLANADGGKRRYESRQQEVAQISVGLKNLAKDIGIPVIALSQLNRNVEREKNRKPQLSDLRESGAIEQDADIVSFLYRVGDAEEAEQQADAESINWNIAAQRSGPRGDVHLTFLRPFTRFESAAAINNADCATANNNHGQGSLPYSEN